MVDAQTGNGTRGKEREINNRAEMGEESGATPIVLLSICCWGAAAQSAGLNLLKAGRCGPAVLQEFEDRKQFRCRKRSDRSLDVRPRKRTSIGNRNREPAGKPLGEHLREAGWVQMFTHASGVASVFSRRESRAARAAADTRLLAAREEEMRPLPIS
eukprot:2176449-Pyramimonas_sp.AAC.1